MISSITSCFKAPFNAVSRCITRQPEAAIPPMGQDEVVLQRAQASGAAALEESNRYGLELRIKKGHLTEEQAQQQFPEAYQAILRKRESKRMIAELTGQE